VSRLSRSSDGVDVRILATTLAFVLSGCVAHVETSSSEVDPVAFDACLAHVAPHSVPTGKQELLCTGEPFGCSIDRVEMPACTAASTGACCSLFVAQIDGGAFFGECSCSPASLRGGS
jgi:hypothetical protein